MAWTGWRLIAQGKERFLDEFDYDGPACYELGVRLKGGRKMRVMYVGETGNEKARVASYVRGRSHLRSDIALMLRYGAALFYRSRATPSKAAAKRMQDGLLTQDCYMWNKRSNEWRRKNDPLWHK